MRSFCGAVTPLTTLACAGLPELQPPPRTHSASGALIYTHDSAGGMSRDEFLATQAEVAESRSVRKEVGSRLAEDAHPQAVEARPSPTGWTLTVAVDDLDPNRATTWCNATLEVLVERALLGRLESYARNVRMQAALLDEARANEDADAAAQIERALQEAIAAEAEARAAPIPVRVLDRCALAPPRLPLLR